MVRAFDMYCGLGGSSHGASSSGATIVGGIDAWDLAARTFADNFPAAHVVPSTVEAQEPRRILEETGPIDLLLASPECTNHSCARGGRPRSDESREAAFEIVRYARAMEPRWIVIENVVQMRTWVRYREFLGALRGFGYQVAEHVLDAADSGVPQRRRRLFLLCDRETEPPRHIAKKPGPMPSAAVILDRPGTWRRSPLDNGRRAPATLARARRAVAALGNGEPFLIVYYGNDGAGGWQPLTVPLRTVTTLDRFGLCEPSEQGLTLRMLQVPELMRAMGFRDDLTLRRGSRRDRIKLLGNGVCPPVMEAVVTELVGRESLESAVGSGNADRPGGIAEDSTPRPDVDTGVGRSSPEPDSDGKSVPLKKVA